jgi:hypothetical protein
MTAKWIRSTRIFQRHSKVLLDKMSGDIEPARCEWLRSYLSGRVQRIRMGDCISSDILVT